MINLSIPYCTHHQEANPIMTSVCMNMIFVNVGSSTVNRRIILGDFVEVGSNIWDISVTFLLFSYEPKTVLKIKNIF